MDFMYDDNKDKNKGQGYTMDDLNDALGEQPQKQSQFQGAGMWGAVGKATQGDNTQLQDKMNKMKEMKKLQKDQFSRKRGLMMGGQNIMNKQQRPVDYGQQTLEQMNLDRKDGGFNYDNEFNNNQGVSTGGSNNFQLQAQNQYMGKETAQRQQFWDPKMSQSNNQSTHNETGVTSQPANELDDLDDLDEIQPMIPDNQYQRQEVQQQQQTPQFDAQIEEPLQKQTTKIKKKKKKKKKQASEQLQQENEIEQRALQQQLELEKEQEELMRQQRALEEEEQRRYEEELALQQQQEVEETEMKLQEIQKKQEQLEAEQAKLEEIQRQQEEEEEQQRLDEERELEEQIEQEKREFEDSKKRNDLERERERERSRSPEEEKQSAGARDREDSGKRGAESEEEEDTGFLDDAPKYYQPGIIPQAPLKPSQKDAYDAFISKLFNPYLPLEEQRDLYMKPLPALIGQVQCTIERSKSGFDRLWPKYTLSLSNGNRYMLTGKKKGMNTTSHYMITIDQQKFAKDANGYLGKVRSNMLGTEFSIYDCKENPKKTSGSKEDVRSQLGVVQYETNVLGSKGPRRMKVLLPMVQRDGQEMYWPDTEVEKNTIQGKFAENETENIMFYFNKPPKWNEQVQAFVLNFNGRVDKASVKNFQLIDEYDDNKIYMQFGRVGKDQFNMDCAFPFSIFQAYAISLSSFDFKFACE